MELVAQIKSNRAWMAKEIREIRNDMRTACDESGVPADRRQNLIIKANLIAIKNLKLDEPKDLYSMRPTTANFLKAKETLASNIEWLKNGFNWDALGCGEQDHVAEQQSDLESAYTDVCRHLAA